jgi:hypothetical protein
MAKKSDNRVEAFREGGMAFITEHFKDMETAFAAYIQEKNWDKAVNLYFKLADKVIPALPTQAAEAASTEKPAWMQKIENAKKTQEK